MAVFCLGKGRLADLTVAASLLLVLLPPTPCNGTGWIVEGRVDAKAPPPCHTLCIHVYREPEVGARLFLAPCSKPNATSKQRWTYDTPTNTFRFRLPSGTPLCLGAPGGDAVALAGCASITPDMKWYLEGNHIRNGNPSDHLYLHAPRHRPYYQYKKKISLQLFLGRGTDGPNITQFTFIPYSAFDYVSPRTDPHSDLIQNGAFSDIEFSTLSNVIESRWRFSICSWIIAGRPNVTVLPAASAVDGRNFSLNLGMGSILQRVPTSPGSAYLLLFRISAGASPVPLIKRLEVLVDYSSAPTRTFSLDAINNRSAPAWETKFVEFVARNESVNVRFIGLGNNLDGVYLDDVQMFLTNTTFPGSGEQACSRSRRRGLDVAAIVVPIIALLVSSTCCLGYALRRRCQRIAAASSGIGHSHSELVVPYGQSVRKYSIAEVRSLTDNFSRQIGEGGFGSVYLGTTTDGQQVAVKRAKQVEGVDRCGFSTEMAMLSKAHHRFVVTLLGFCDDDDELILLYEYMPNGSLYKHLHNPNAPTILSWTTRVRIAFQVACALEYLHNGADPPILHRDVKSSNVLMSNDYCAKIADFGISKVGQIKENGVASTLTQLKGTKGYIDPQYCTTGLLSPKSDVYGFGVVLLEIITGRKAFQDSETLVAWVERFFDDISTNNNGQKSIWHIVDNRLRTMEEGQIGCDEIEALLKIALMCVDAESGKRPTMFEVVRMMKLQFHSYI